MHYTDVNPEAFAKRLAHENPELGLYEYYDQQELIAEDFVGFERVVVEWMMMDLERFMDTEPNQRMKRIEKILMKLLKHFTDEDSLEEPFNDWFQRRGL